MSERDDRGFTPDQIDGIRAGIQHRRTTTDRAGLRGLDRVEIEVLEGLEYRATNPHEAGTMRIGEPVARGGTGEGSSPLSLVLAGASSCLMNQFIRSSVADDLPVRFTGASVKGEFSRAVGGGFERITAEFRAEGSLTDDQARDLVETAERLCYIHVTLRQAVQMTTVLIVDGVERARSATGPEVASHT
jgi:uncharacterized OsmC-like protein